MMKKKLNSRIMVWIITSLLLLALPMTALAENEYEIIPISAQGEIISDVNVRSGPGTDHDKIGTVREKETVIITGISTDGWYEIEYEGAQGFIYGDYVAVVEAPQEDQDQEAEMEEAGDDTDPAEAESVGQESDETEAENSGPIGQMLKAAAVAVIIFIIVMMIFLTIRSLRQTDDREDEEDEEDYEDEDYDDTDDEDYEDDDIDEYDGREYHESGRDEEEEIVKPVKTDPQTIVIREEDYQLHIDPKYFEDEPIKQPEFVTGYLKEKEEREKEEERQKNQSGELQKAMDKLQELEAEIEKLKKNR